MERRRRAQGSDPAPAGYKEGVPMPKQSRLLTTDRALRDGFVLHPKDREALAAGKVIAAEPLPEHLAAAREVGAFITPPGLEEHSAALNLYFEIMHGMMALVVRTEPAVAAWVADLRLQKRYSWRMVAQAMHDTHGAPWQPEWNELGGMALCRAVAEKQEQDFMEPPWN
jgi:hypothetical protein